MYSLRCTSFLSHKPVVTIYSIELAYFLALQLNCSLMKNIYICFFARNFIHSIEFVCLHSKFEFTVCGKHFRSSLTNNRQSYCCRSAIEQLEMKFSLSALTMQTFFFTLRMKCNINAASELFDS